MSALPKSTELPQTSANADGQIAPPPQHSVGQLLREKRIVLGWTLEQASRKTGIPAKSLSAIEEMHLNRFINEGAKLEHHIRVYANRLGQSLHGYESLIEKARQIIRPNEVTQDQLDMIRQAK